MLSQNLATLADTVILQRHAYHTRSDVKHGRTVVGTHARAGRLILRTFQCGLWRCAIPHASRCRVSSPSSGYAAPRLLEVWWDSSWPLPLPSSHGYATSRATPQRTELRCAEPNEKMLCQCFHVAVAHHWLASHARLLLLSPAPYFKACPRVFVVQAFTMFILFFFRFTLRGGCTIIVEFLKCLRGECLASMRRTTIPGGYRGLLLQCPLPLSFEVNVRKWTFMQPLVLRRI